ncbi:TIGR03619 family F420-dependent LLM class oxidoreductase [Gordonia rubripertincta]|uniref:TIGR03619 family F420-dependent LLM class oxidoreductase n=1 Tax=Gordonia rubripertincta TaxID=36822 RepID=A0AAW4G0R3_GORRU|nr:TIGR03619 family F420-dependent LLM class oxidoreductase [Gordonia rubripertincta]MBM7276967.1 TIGR03619 family F420-dependent LLM class oxidoreductase [Gordonia rubripertincta]
MKFTLEYPGDVPGASPLFLEGAALAQIAGHAQDLGFDALCLADHPAPSAKWFAAGGHDSFEPAVALAYAAAATTSLTLMTNLYVLPFRNPYLAAKALTTLDILSGGRLIVGVGAGYLRSEFAALGVDFDDRAALFDEAIDTLRRIWLSPSTPVAGEGFGATTRMRLHRPIQEPHPPLWIGGNSRAAIRRVVSAGQGWCPVLGPEQMTTSIRTAAMPGTGDLRRAVGRLKAELVRAGRDPVEISIQVEAPPVDVADVRSVRRFVERVDELGDVGVTHLCVHADARSVDAASEFVAAFSELVIRPPAR